MGRGVKKAKTAVYIKKEKEENGGNENEEDEDGVFGCVPQALLEEEQANLDTMLNQDIDMVR